MVKSAKRKKISSANVPAGVKLACVVNPFDVIKDDPRDSGTKETKQKLLVRHDVVESMLRRGRITMVQFQAAEEIREIWEAVSARGMRSMGPDYEQDRVDCPPGHHDFMDDLTKHQLWLFADCYGPWQKKVSPVRRLPIKLSNRTVIVVDPLEIVMAVVIHNNRLEDIEEWRKLHTGTARRVVTWGLQQYCDLHFRR